MQQLHLQMKDYNPARLTDPIAGVFFEWMPRKQLFVLVYLASIIVQTATGDTSHSKSYIKNALDLVTKQKQAADSERPLIAAAQAKGYQAFHLMLLEQVRRVICSSRALAPTCRPTSTKLLTLRDEMRAANSLARASSGVTERRIPLSSLTAAALLAPHRLATPQPAGGTATAGVDGPGVIPRNDEGGAQHCGLGPEPPAPARRDAAAHRWHVSAACGWVAIWCAWNDGLECVASGRCWVGGWVGG